MRDRSPRNNWSFARMKSWSKDARGAKTLIPSWEQKVNEYFCGLRRRVFLGRPESPILLKYSGEEFAAWEGSRTFFLSRRDTFCFGTASNVYASQRVSFLDRLISGEVDPKTKIVQPLTQVFVWTWLFATIHTIEKKYSVLFHRSILSYRTKIPNDF